jgi:HPt (histidine-containing phosphotransfer) domain-containing protein
VTAGAVETGPTPGRDESDAPIVDCGRARSCGPALLELFMREADDTLQRLRAAFERGDAGGVREAAHGLKGASGYVGASRVGETSARIEGTVRSGGIVDPREIERLGEEIGALRRELLIVTAAASDA